MADSPTLRSVRRARLHAFGGGLRDRAVVSDAGQLPGGKYARRFDGTDDDLRTSVGNLDPTGAVSLCAWIRRGRDDVAFQTIQTTTSGGGFVHGIGISVTGELATQNGFGSSTSSGLAISQTDGWVFIAATKPAGSSVARLHLYRDGAWTHQNGTGALGAYSSIAGGSVRFGTVFGVVPMPGDILAAAMWSSELDDTAVEGLLANSTTLDWINAGGADAAWEFSQDEVTTSVVDLTGGGADQTLLTGTRVIDDAPNDWRNVLPLASAPTGDALYAAAMALGPEVYWRPGGEGSSDERIRDVSGNDHHAEYIGAAHPGGPDLGTGGDSALMDQRQNHTGIKALDYKPFAADSVRSFVSIMRKDRQYGAPTTFAGSGVNGAAPMTPHPTWEWISDNIIRFYGSVNTFPAGWADITTPPVTSSPVDGSVPDSFMLGFVYDDATGLCDYWVNGAYIGQVGPLGYADVPLTYDAAGDPGLLQWGFRGNGAHFEVFEGASSEMMTFESALSSADMANLASAAGFGQQLTLAPASASASPTLTVSPPTPASLTLGTASAHSSATASVSAKTEIVIGHEAGFAVGGAFQSQTESEIEADLDRMVAIGAKWVRTDINFAQIQPIEANPPDWTLPDTVINAALERGLKVLASIVYTPAWARGGSGANYGPTGAYILDFCAFAYAAAARYSALGVHAYEVWNEPNIQGSPDAAGWGPAPDPAAFTTLLNATTAYIKVADPSATVVSGGTAPAETDGTNYEPIDFIEAMYAAGANFDVIGIHPYCHPVMPSSTEGWSAWYKMVNYIRPMMVAEGDGAKKIWATEVGWWTGGDGAVTEAFQANAIYEALNLFASYSWSGPLFVYMHRDQGTSPTSREDHFGVYALDGSPKAGALLFAFGAQAINGAVRATSAASLALKTPKTVPLATSSASSSATLGLTATTAVPLASATATSDATVALAATTTVPLASADAVAAPTLDLTAPTVGVAYVGVGTEATDTAGTTGARDMVPTIPAGAVEGDLLLLAVYFRNNFGTGMNFVPTGWTKAGSAGIAGTGTLGFYWRVMQSGDTAPAFTVNDVTVRACQIAAFRGVDSSAPIGGIGWDAPDSGSSQDIGPISGGTTVAAGEAVVFFGGKRDDWTSVADLTGDSLTWVEIDEVIINATTAIVWDYGIAPTGTITSKTFTVTGGTSAAWIGQAISLAPDSPGVVVSLSSADAISDATLALAAPTQVPLATAAATAAPTLALSATTQVPLASAAAASTATLALTATTRVPLATAAASSTATLALSATTRVTLGSAAASSSATVALTATGLLTLGSAAGQATSTLALTAPTRVPLASAAAVAGPTLALSAASLLALSSAAGASTATAAFTAPTSLALSTVVAASSTTLAISAPSLFSFSSAAISAATLSLKATTTIPLAPADAAATASLALRAPPQLSLSSAGVSNTALAVSAQTRITLGAAAATSSTTLALTATTTVALAAATAAAAPTLSISAKTEVPLAPSSAGSSATLALSARTEIPLDPAGGQASSSLDLGVPVELVLDSADALSTSDLALSAQTEVALGSASAVAAATLILGSTNVPTFILTSAASSSSTLELTAPTELALEDAAGASSAELTLSAQTEIPLSSATASSSASASFTAQTTLLFGAADAQTAPTLSLAAPTGLSLTATAASTATLSLTATALLSLSASAAHSAATAALTAPAILPLGASDASSAATLSLSARTELPLGAAAATSTTTLSLGATNVPLLSLSSAGSSSSSLAVSAPTTIPLGSSAATAGAALALSARTSLTLAAAAQTSATLSLTAATGIALGPATAQSAATLALRATTSLGLATASATSSASLTLTAPSRLTLATAASSSTSLSVGIGAKIMLLGAAGGASTTSLALSAQTGLALSSSATATASLALQAPTVIALDGAAATSTTYLGLAAAGQLGALTADASSTASLDLIAYSQLTLSVVVGASGGSLAVNAPRISDAKTFAPIGRHQALADIGGHDAEADVGFHRAEATINP